MEETLARAGKLAFSGTSVNGGGVLTSFMEDLYKRALSIEEILRAEIHGFPARVFSGVMGKANNIKILTIKGTKTRLRLVNDYVTEVIVSDPKESWSYEELPVGTRVSVVYDRETAVYEMYFVGRKVCEVEEKDFNQKIPFATRSGEIIYVVLEGRKIAWFENREQQILYQEPGKTSGKYLEALTVVALDGTSHRLKINGKENLWVEFFMHRIARKIYENIQQRAVVLNAYLLALQSKDISPKAILDKLMPLVEERKHELFMEYKSRAGEQPLRNWKRDIAVYGTRFDLDLSLVEEDVAIHILSGEKAVEEFIRYDPQDNKVTALDPVRQERVEIDVKTSRVLLREKRAEKGAASVSFILSILGLLSLAAVFVGRPDLLAPSTAEAAESIWTRSGLWPTAPPDNSPLEALFVVLAGVMTGYSIFRKLLKNKETIAAYFKRGIPGSLSVSRDSTYFWSNNLIIFALLFIGGYGVYTYLGDDNLRVIFSFSLIFAGLYIPQNIIDFWIKRFFGPIWEALLVSWYILRGQGYLERFIESHKPKDPTERAIMRIGTRRIMIGALW